MIFVRFIFLVFESTVCRIRIQVSKMLHTAKKFVLKTFSTKFILLYAVMYLIFSDVER